MTENSHKMTKLAPQVVVLAYDGLCTFEFGVAVEIFGLPRPEMGEHWYRFAVAAVDEGELRATGGVRLMADGNLSLLEHADTIIVPGWRGIDSPVPNALCQALQRANQRGCRMLSICSGVFVLAAAGLLSGKQATTHWRYTEELQQRFPQIQVVEDVLYMAEDNVFTSAGSAAGIDLCLHVVRLDYGLEIANQVARRLVIQPHRDGAQKQQIEQPVARSRESQRLGMLYDFLHQHLAESHSVRSLAERVGMSERTFLRRFQDATGHTPARWLLEARLQLAQHHLATGRDSMEKVAEISGFGNARNLRLRFQQHLAISPLAYRKKFTATNN
ncbi:transcriptional regulator FtrA [Kluyvera cryocrescens]|uniref:Transcriptional regulator FtrA n=1 Tax=Kluyvera cryocrescens TaxID=580 RepID=A0AAW9C4Q8_KLUCR|nr:transcriptional regulator FtrA [Kluyvera cryocrescens]MDW3777161.1 transcriptional regulator FtrA [Kluyvera cryocrescens]HDG1686428.1 transcriptional regulator FtrA [Kluyvera cryocrescens]